MEEIWKPVANYTGYKVSNTGHVKRSYSDGSEDIIDHQIQNNSRRTVRLYETNSVDEEPMTLHIDELVLNAFGEEKPKGAKKITHINKDLRDDSLENLEWHIPPEMRDPNAPRKNYRSVNQVTADGHIVSTYASISKASQATGISYQGIIKCCSGTQKTAGGFSWVYTDTSVVKTLKSCPFCGGKCEPQKVENLLQSLLGTDCKPKYVGKCLNCGLTSPEFDSEDELLIYWNKRY